MKIEEAKQITMHRLLEQLGHAPVAERKGEAWYASPLRQETAASFKLTRDGRAWFDHGAGQGGNILDFVMAYYDTDVVGALQALDRLQGMSGEQWRPSPIIPAAALATPKSSMFVSHLQPLTSQALKYYLQQRGIPASVAAPYVEEIHYVRNDKPYFALAFANVSGGYELRNPYFKGTYGAKDISPIRPTQAASDSVAIFEGFMDFLSAIVVAGHPPQMQVIVMNSVAMKGKTIEAVRHDRTENVYLYFDNDEAGRQLTTEFQITLRDRNISDMSGIYAQHKDLNEFLVAKHQAKQPVPFR